MEAPAQDDGGKVGSWYQENSTATPFTLTSDRWAEYVKYRPVYPQSLFKTWLDYHKGPLHTAHEIGTGCGIGTAGLLDVAAAEGKSIERMIVSDPAPSNIATTQQNLASGQYPKTNFSFHQKKAEERFLEPGSVDFVFACETLHWCDIDPTMEHVLDSLRPGGTFAAVYYSMLEAPNCSDERVSEMVSKFLVKQRIRMINEQFGGKMPETAKRVLRQIDGLNFISFPPDKWEVGAKRIYVNVPDGEVHWFRDSFQLLDDVIKSGSVSNVEKDRDSLAWEHDEDWVQKARTIDWLKGTIISMETSQNLVEDSPEWESDEWKAVETAMEAAGGKIDVTVRVSIVLARKK